MKNKCEDAEDKQDEKNSKKDAPHDSDNSADETEEAAIGVEAGNVEEMNLAIDEEDEKSKTISALKQQADEYKDKYLRAAAEMENMRKRVEREKTEILQYGLEKFLGDLLPVLDSFDLATGPEKEGSGEPARNSGGKPSDSFYTGIQLVRKQLETVLARAGLKPIHAKGQPFDPNVHQAIQRMESNEVERETVKDEFVKGYFLKERLLRPAIVSVMVPAPDKENI